MVINSVRNLTKVSGESYIDMEVLFEGFEDYIPFTATPDDSTVYGRELYHLASTGYYGEVVEVVREEFKPDPVALRKEAYTLESDPIYMEWQYDQDPEVEALWRAKVAEIKARYPLV